MLVAVPGGALVVGEKGTDALLVDGRTLDVVWSTRFARPISSVSGDERWLVFFLEGGAATAVKR